MKGGRIRGQGTYGCVFQPALLCRGINKSISDGSQVGKITSIQDARNELIIAKYLHTIPESSDYVVVADPDSCIPLSKSKQSDQDLKFCKFSENMPLEKTIQIIMPWGGQPLNQINLDPRSFNFLEFTKDLLSIGGFLLLNDVCHMDLWGQNLLFNKQTKPKLIDFGFAFRPSQLVLNDLKSRWRAVAVDHDTETPEVTLMLGIFKGISSSELIDGLRTSKPAVQRLVNLCDVLPNEWANELQEWTRQSQGFQHKDWLSCWKLYWPGFDAWGIGAVLLLVLEIQMASPGFIDSHLWVDHGEKIQEVLRGLCRANPIHRMDALEALSKLTDGSHSLISAGSAGSVWVSEKQRRRPHP
jgi:hypothetical protein